jgi:hypothetical protein
VFVCLNVARLEHLKTRAYFWGRAFLALSYSMSINEKETKGSVEHQERNLGADINNNVNAR